MTCAAMLVDLHVHTRLSADSGVEPVAYLRAIAQAGNPLSGICFTEHRLFPADEATERRYAELADRFGIAIFRGVEADTDLGHLLILGVTPGLTRRFDLSRRLLKSEALVEATCAEGGIAIPAHPFRDSGFGTRLESLKAKLGRALTAVEAFNGQNTEKENESALAASAKLGLTAVAGSDAHFCGHKWFLTCATKLERPVKTVEGLCEELRTGRASPHIFQRTDSRA